MKTTVDGKRYVYIQSPLVADLATGERFKCRVCVADPQKKHKYAEDVFTLHNALSAVAPETPNNTLCCQGFWVRDTKAGRAEAVVYLLEQS